MKISSAWQLPLQLIRGPRGPRLRRLASSDVRVLRAQKPRRLRPSRFLYLEGEAVTVFVTIIVNSFIYEPVTQRVAVGTTWHGAEALPQGSFMRQLIQ